MHHAHHHRSDIPLFIFGSYVVGYLAGHTLAVLWIHGPTEADGVRRLAHVRPTARPTGPSASVTDAAGAGAPTRTRAA